MEFNKNVIVVINNDVEEMYSGLSFYEAESCFLTMCSNYIMNFNSYTEFEVHAMLDHGKEDILRYVDGKLTKIGIIRLI